MSERSENIVILGAGLVGSLQALLLAQKGYRVRVYDKLPDIRQQAMSAGRSINLALASRGRHALEQADVLDKAESLLIPMRGRMLHNQQGEQTLQKYGSRDHEAIYSVSRAGLVSLLRDEAEATGLVTFYFEHSCDSIDFNGNRCQFSHRDVDLHIDFDYLLACDGAGSMTRQQMQQNTDNATAFNSELLDHAYKELYLPPDKKGDFQLDKNALHVWPRDDYMMIGLPNPGGDFTLTLFMPKTGPVSFASIDNATALHALFDQQFADIKPFIPKLEQDYFNNPTGKLGTVRCQQWYQDHVLLLGDAAHAVVPFHAQGMNAGFEDCVAVMEALAHSNHDWSGLFATVQMARQANADAIADMSLENYVEMRASVNDPQFHFKKQVAFALEQRWPHYFIPRYSMVMFHRIPYAEAYARGRVQARLLDRLCHDIDTVDALDFERVERLIKGSLSPILNET
ncbi:FAD-dependent oxidoreductase [Marinicella gelatinilytica]|uniref:FAD-dependent oxidoreductase n=1 Tax=Marinicella gelatinilytica TaxID=2996017 RepID=UPI002260C57E|nr:NAD(P)/FAD-dependent oxidoreductase [Marinicella gelatinilytica]MCX7545412.1 NAD(P)/FAD-dependent oxidoreductase [Marinicella gelatinilytica]